MKAHVMTWRDPSRDETRALVDRIDADGNRWPGGAARGVDEPSLSPWIKAILIDIEATEVRHTDCGDLTRPSFDQVRSRALFRDAKAGA